MSVAIELQITVIETLRQGAPTGWMDGRELAEQLGRTRNGIQSIINSMRGEWMLPGWVILSRKAGRFSEYRASRSQDWYYRRLLLSPVPMTFLPEGVHGTK